MKLIIFDFDGTLTASLWRKKFYLSKDYDKFHEMVEDDLVNEDIFNVFISALVEDDTKVIISTARPRKHIRSMTNWISIEADFLESKLSSINIFCRGDSDIRPSMEVKKANIKKLLERYGDDYDFITVYEDRQDCCDMYKEFDMNVIKVEEI